MLNIPPRLNHLLHILLREGRPEPVKALADRLGVSRRTVFRELENVDLLLRPYELHIDTQPGEGIFLAGRPEARERLRLDLERAGDTEPTSRRERRLFLQLELLASPEQRKLFYFADRFEVSEATVSYDLDALEPWFRKHSLRLMRKPGVGVSVEGTEIDFRRALCAVLAPVGPDRARVLDFSVPGVADGIHQLMVTRLDRHLQWMTGESRQALENYMIVTVQRVLTHQPLGGAGDGGSAVFRPQADALADMLELQFETKFSPGERDGLAVFLAACRGAEPVDAQHSGAEFQLQRLAYRMIEQFDPALATRLKLDDQLVEGLTVHLQSAVPRLQNRIELQDPLLEQLARSYPETLEKSRRAARVLEEVAPHVPDSEAGFLATHFGAAMMRLREHGGNRLQVGIVCAHGIGMSYLMASQVRRSFGGGVECEVGGPGDVADWSRFDLVITTIPLELEIPVVRVHPILTPEDIAAIRAEMDRLTARSRPAAVPVERISLAERCGRLESILADVRRLLERFDVLPAEADCAFEQLAGLAGYRFGNSEADGRCIYEDLMRRERISTQVVEELELILLHARTQGVRTPVFSLILPEGGRFADPGLGGARACVVMLAPPELTRARTELMGRLSSALLEDAAIFDAVLGGDRERAYERLEAVLHRYLVEKMDMK